MDLFWQINWEEMLSDLIVTTFLILLDASIVVVCSMVMFPLIDLAFKKSIWPSRRRLSPSLPRLNLGTMTAFAHHAQLSGPPWLATRSKFLRPDAVPHSQLMSYPTAQERAVERITPLIARSLVPKGSEGAPPGPVTAPPTPLTSNCGRASETLSSGNLFSAKGRPGPPGDPNKEEPGRPSRAA
jgi:hypothetical protein